MRKRLGGPSIKKVKIPTRKNDVCGTPARCPGHPPSYKYEERSGLSCSVALLGSSKWENGLPVPLGRKLGPSS